MAPEISETPKLVSFTVKLCACYND